MAKLKDHGRYVLRIYKIKYCFDRYDDTIYRVSNGAVDPNDIRITRYADTEEELLDVWNVLLQKYEGYTYCIWDVLLDARIVGGVMDPSDDEYIEDYFN